jgi:hypothetical protein
MRSGIIIAIFAAVGVVYWFVLPVVQTLLLPDAPGGTSGPWIVRPEKTTHIFTVMALGAVTTPLLVWPLSRVWKRQDIALGSKYVSFQRRTAWFYAVMIQGLLLAVVYASAILFYLFSWTVISPDGIEQHLPWTTRKYPFQSVSSLRISRRNNDLVYEIYTQDGNYLPFSKSNEGTTSDELAAMTAFIAARTGQQWNN